LESERHSGEDSIKWVRLFTKVERFGAAGKTLAARRVEQSKLHTRSGRRSAAEFLATETGDSVGETKELIRLGENLEDQPQLSEAFRDGEVSRRRASLVSDAVKENPDKESELVEGAKRDSDAQLKERCLRAKAQGRSKEDEARHHQRMHQNRRCRTFTDADGAFGLTALLTPDTGARVLSALEAQAHRVFDQARKSGEWESPDAYRADAMVALITGKGILGPHIGTKRADATDTATPTRSATTATSADSAPSTAPSSNPTTTSDRAPDPRAQLFIRADLDALRRGRVQGGERCEIPGIGPVSVETAIAHLGVALTHLVITDGVDVTTVYSPGRHIPMAIRAALIERDSNCVVPGCDSRLTLENDHWAVDYAKGGPTTLANLARICHRHHQQRTHQGFQLLGGPGKWQWIAPTTPVVPKRPKSKRKPKTKAPPRPDASPPLFDRLE
jgi:hypothetical protein